MVAETYQDRLEEALENAQFWKSETDATEGVDILESPPESFVVSGLAVVAGMATRRCLMAGWSQVAGKKPPVNPNAAGVTWTDAMIWAAAVGAAVGTARVLARKGTAVAAEKYYI